MKKLSLLLLLSVSPHAFSMSRALSSCRTIRPDATRAPLLQVPQSYWWTQDHVDSFAKIAMTSPAGTGNLAKDILIYAKMFEDELSQHEGKVIDDCNRNHFQCMGGILLSLQRWSTGWLEVLKKVAKNDAWTSSEYFEREYELHTVPQSKAGHFETAIGLMRVAKKLEFELNERTFTNLIRDDERDQFLLFGGLLTLVQKMSTERLAGLEKLAQTDWWLPEHIDREKEKASHKRD